MLKFLTATLCLAAATLVAAPATASEEPLQEIHGDWQLACATRGESRHCAMLQQQASQQKKRVLAIELNVAGSGAAGMLILPFGLDLDHGVRLQIDDQSSFVDVRFHTCIAAGCLVPLVFDGAMLKRLRGATFLKIRALTADGGNAAVFSVSLQGFGAVLDRAVALSP